MVEPWHDDNWNVRSGLAMTKGLANWLKTLPDGVMLRQVFLALLTSPAR